LLPAKESGFGVREMKNRIAAMAACALTLAPGLAVAQSGNGGAGPVKPGSVRITTRAPEPSKWISQKSADGTQRVFKCKPLACPDPQTVSFKFSKSPVRSPDPKALERFATVDFPKTLRAAAAARSVLDDRDEKLEILEAKTTTLKGYPSVLNVSKMSGPKKTTYIHIAIIFAGPLMIRVQSTSLDQELAQKTLNEFIAVMKIDEAPTAPSGPGSAIRSL
jgi:hypothetical protein